MSAAMKKPVHGGRRYTARFRNDNASTGAAVLLVTWVPNQESSVPPARQISLAPTMLGEISDEIPASTDVRRMVVVVALDAGERGELEVLENDTLHSSEAIAELTTWQMVVI